jgi:hypothetical protein
MALTLLDEVTPEFRALSPRHQWEMGFSPTLSIDEDGLLVISAELLAEATREEVEGALVEAGEVAMEGVARCCANGSRNCLRIPEVRPEMEMHPELAADRPEF